MGASLTTLDPVLKELYPDNEVANTVYRDHPIIKLLPRDTKDSGDNRVTAIKYGNTNRVGAVFATAQANTGTTKTAKFNVTRIRDYAFATIENEVILASASDEGAMVRAVEFEVDGAIEKVKNRLASALFRNGTGSVGQISSSSNVASTSITLADKADAVNFEVDDIIQLTDSDGGTLRNSGNSIQITGIDRTTGVITFGGALSSSIAAAAAGDYIVIESDNNAKISGFSAWVPLSAPGATSFFGVDRSVDPVRLGGNRFDGRGLPVREALTQGIVRAALESGRPDVCVVNHVQWAELSKSLQSHLYFPNAKQGDVNFEYLVLHSANGPLKIIADRFCQADRAWLLEMDTWELFSLGQVPRILDLDGKYAREATADAYEVRVGLYGQLRCKAPGRNCVVRLDVPA